ncbi:MAG: hypothetical protein ABSB19_05075 [Methylomonas sp.]|jgi:hypothetical protein
MIKLHNCRGFWLIICLFLKAADVFSADWIFDGSLNQLTGYDNNFGLRQTPIGTFEFFLTPKVNFKRNDDDWNVQGSASYGLRQYSYSIYNNNPQNYNVNGDYRTAHTVWGLNASYAQVLTNSVASSDTGNFLTSSMRTTQSLAPRFSYTLNKFDTINLSGMYMDNNYTAGSGFSNNTTESGTLGWKRRWTERLSQNVTGSFSRSSFNNAAITSLSGVTQTYSGNVGFTYEIAQQWDVSATLGERFTNQNYTGLAGTNTSGWTASSNLSHEGMQSSQSIGFSRQVNPSGLGVLNQVTQVNASYTYKWSEKWNAVINGVYLLSDPVGLNVNTNSALANRTYFTVQPALNWQMDRDITINLAFMFREQEYIYTAQSKALLLTFNYNWSGFKVSR